MDLLRVLQNISSFCIKKAKKSVSLHSFYQSCYHHPCYQTKSNRNDTLNRKQMEEWLWWCIIILSNKFYRICKFWTLHQKWKWKVITFIWISHALYGTVEKTYNILFWRNRGASYNDNQVTGMTLTEHTLFSWIAFFFFKNVILSTQQTILFIVNANRCLQVLNTFSVLVFKHLIKLSLLLLNGLLTCYR